MASDLMILAILILLSACFSGAETALFSVGLIRIKTLAKSKPAAALIEKMRENPKRVLGALLLGNNVVNISASALVTVIVMNAFGSAAVGISTGAFTLVILIFAEFLPKTYAAQHSEKIALAVARPLYWLAVAAGPLIRLFDVIASLVVRKEADSPTPFISEEEIKTMASMAVKAGTVEKGEKELIERVFLMNDISALDVMTPREEVVFLDGGRPLPEALSVMSGNNYSRYPVTEGGDEDKIIGIVHIKDVLNKLTENPMVPIHKLSVGELAEPAQFVPHTKPIDDLLRDMQKQHSHMAVVINEFGSTVGVVTMEDLIEELVGEIADESDVEEHFIKRVDRLNLVVHGDVEIKDINRFFNVKIQAPPHKTLGWVITSELGSIPQAGQQVRIADGLMATVLEMLNLRIHKVRLTKADEQAISQNAR